MPSEIASDQTLECMPRQVITSTAASASAGITAQAISRRRRGADRKTEARMATWATPQTRAAAQKRVVATIGDSAKWLCIVATGKVTAAATWVNQRGKADPSRSSLALLSAGAPLGKTIERSFRDGRAHPSILSHA